MEGLDRRSLITGGCGALLIPTLADASGTDAESWINEPKRWSRANGTLTIHAEPKTDFWRKTFFGYITDNGHFLGGPVSGDFSATVRVSGDYAAQYDQAGLMVRLDAGIWMKCGVEFVDGLSNISSVFTRDFSDWAGIPRDSAVETMWFRLVRKGSALTFSYSEDAKAWREVRQGYLTDAPVLQVGVMAAAPEGPGFDARFSELRIEPA